MHDIAGLVALAVMALWIAYLVPHRLRYRQQLLESRTEDRFSAALRVLVVTDARRRDPRTARAECGPGGPKRSGLLSPARGVPVRVGTDGRGGVVERPYGTQDRITADDARRAAQVRARRAAALARRQAAARRRGVLTGVLLGASILAWVVVGVASLPVTVAVVPTLLLAGVVGLGRRAVVTARRADEAWERQQQRRAARTYAPAPRVTGRAHHPSDSHTEAIARVGGASDADLAPTSTHHAVPTAGMQAPVPGVDSPTTDTAAEDDADVPVEHAAPAPAPAGAAEGTAAVEVAAASDGGPSEGWSPVPVPRPTYTTKASAPRREPLPLVVEAPAATTEAASVPIDAGEDVVPVTAPVDLDAILARRRAAGE